ncbi:MAG: hypothetical protein Tsb0021_18110 [Chlamydiales bacterium]
MGTDNTLPLIAVLPNEEDGQLILSWRNDPLTLRMSYHSQKKTWEEFSHEFYSQYFIHPELPPFFAGRRGKKVGLIRFRYVEDPVNPKKRCCDLSLVVDPEARGQGLGSCILQSLIPWLKTRPIDTVLAEIKVENEASLKTFVRAGFQELDRVDKYIEDIGQWVRIARFIYPVNNRVCDQPSLFIVAEAGSNWKLQDKAQSLQRAYEFIEAAVEAGADAVKFQTFRVDSLYVSNAGKSGYLKYAGIDQDIVSLLKEYEMPYELIPKLASFAKSKGIEWMSSIFSEEAFENVNPYVKRHKIASYEISDPHLIRRVALSGKPLILSTGASTITDIEWAVKEFRRHGGKDLTLLQCTAKYPANIEAMNLSAIPKMRELFGVPIGLSDHSAHPYIAPLIALGYGATVIEKHFTLSHDGIGPDDSVSSTVQEFKAMVAALRKGSLMLGSGFKTIEPSEQELSLFASRSLQAIRDIQMGERLSEGKNFAILRPGNCKKGVHARFLTLVEGSVANKHIASGDGIQLKDITQEK